MQRLLRGAAIGMLWVTAAGLAQQTIGRTSMQGAQAVRVSGAIEVEGGEMLLGNGSMITAGEHTVKVRLERGGDLKLCQSTTLHLSQQKMSSGGTAGGPLMLALDRGSFEASYSIAKGSDVLMTPDLRILISGPGQADVRVRVNGAGDTCVENRGLNAPYVTVAEQIGDGVYRVQADQRVLFEHGSLKTVVDNEPEPCGCPVERMIAGNSAAVPGTNGGGSPADESTKAKADAGEFPLAVSEGLAPASTAAEPVVKPGETHVQVSTQLRYDGDGASGAPGASGASGAPAPLTASREDSSAVAGSGPVTPAQQPVVASPAQAQPPVVVAKKRKKAPDVVTGPPVEVATTVVPAERAGTAHPASVPAKAEAPAQPAAAPVQHEGFFKSLGHLLKTLFGR